MIFITGDIHADTLRFSKGKFPAQDQMTKDDYMIILGDFGLVWDWVQESKEEIFKLNELNDRSFTTLFIDGNHENFNRLKDYPIIEWHGGKVHQIRESVLHLMRGEIYDIDGYSFFVFGGAASHDIQGLATIDELEADYTAGIFQIDDPDLQEKTKMCRKYGRFYRIEDVSWWRDEMPSKEEMEYGKENLAKHGNKVDFILTHDCAASMLPFVGIRKKPDKLEAYLEEIKQSTEYKKWFFGHHHMNKVLPTGEECMYGLIKQIG